MRIIRTRVTILARVTSSAIVYSTVGFPEDRQQPRWPEFNDRNFGRTLVPKGHNDRAQSLIHIELGCSKLGQTTTKSQPAIGWPLSGGQPNLTAMGVSRQHQVNAQ